MKSKKTTINSFLGSFRSTAILGHNGPIYGLDADEKFIYSGSSDKFVTRWDKANGKQDSFAVRCESTPFSLKLFLNQTKLAIGLSTGQLHIVDLLTKSEVHHITQHKTAVFSMLESKENGLLLVGDAEGFLSIWQTDTMKLVLVLPLDCGKIRSIKHVNERTVVIACGNGEVRFLELEFMNELQRFYAHEGGVTAICMDKRNHQLITGGKDGYLRWWDAQTFQLLKALPAHKGSIYGIEYVEEDLFISVSRDKSAKMWDSQNRSVLDKWENNLAMKRQSVNVLWGNQMGQFAFSGDDKIIHFFSKDAEN